MAQSQTILIVSGGLLVYFLELSLSIMSIGYCFDLVKAVYDPFDSRSHHRQANTLKWTIFVFIIDFVVYLISLSKGKPKLQEFLQNIINVIEVIFLVLGLIATFGGILCRKGVNKQVKCQIGLK